VLYALILDCLLTISDARNGIFSVHLFHSYIECFLVTSRLTRGLDVCFWRDNAPLCTQNRPCYHSRGELNRQIAFRTSRYCHSKHDPDKCEEKMWLSTNYYGLLICIINYLSRFMICKHIETIFCEDISWNLFRDTQKQ